MHPVMKFPLNQHKRGRRTSAPRTIGREQTHVHKPSPPDPSELLRDIFRPGRIWGGTGRLCIFCALVAAAAVSLPLLPLVPPPIDEYQFCEAIDYETEDTTVDHESEYEEAEGQGLDIESFDISTASMATGLYGRHDTKWQPHVVNCPRGV
jgi:hypothetical protein